MTDLIRREDALALPHRLSPSLDAADGYYVSVDAIAALPSVTVPVVPQPVRYCPICDIADCATHRDLAALTPNPVDASQAPDPVVNAPESAAPDARNDAVQFLYKHGELTYSAAAAAIAKLCNNGFHITRAPLADALAVPTDGVATLAEALEARVKQRGMGLGRAFTIRDLDLMDKAAAALRAIGERANG